MRESAGRQLARPSNHSPIPKITSAAQTFPRTSTSSADATAATEASFSRVPGAMEGNSRGNAPDLDSASQSRNSAASG